jgi:phosphate transport system permease protein
MIGVASAGWSFAPRLQRRRLQQSAFLVVGVGAIMLGVGALALLLGDVLVRGLGWLSWEFLQSFDSRFAARAGIKAAIAGTAYMMFFTLLFAVPIGILSAVFLEEFASDNWFTRFVEINLANLAGVPSIIYGLLGLGVFVRSLELGRSVLAGSLTMALLVLPIIIVAAREGLRAVPPSIREASLGLGATRWQTVWSQILPPAMPTILTGVILALSRAIGEAAPLIMIGALTFLAFTPESPFDQFTVLPIQIYNWVSRPQAGFSDAAAAGIVVLLVVLLSMNALAILLRNHFERSRRW